MDLFSRCDRITYIIRRNQRPFFEAALNNFFPSPETTFKSGAGGSLIVNTKDGSPYQGNITFPGHPATNIDSIGFLVLISGWDNALKSKNSVTKFIYDPYGGGVVIEVADWTLNLVIAIGWIYGTGAGVSTLIGVDGKVSWTQ